MIMKSKVILKILIIDDEVVTLNLTKQGLEKLGYEVEIFSMATKALSYIGDHHKEIDLIISDKSMPFMGGLELLKEVRKIDPILPVYILTGYSSQEDDQEFLKAGVTKILTKPISLKELQKEIDMD